jgi:hypothetical protein
MPQFVIVRTALDDFYPSAALVNSSSTERVRLRKHTGKTLEPFNHIALKATCQSFVFHWGLHLWQESWIVDFPYHLPPH